MSMGGFETTKINISGRVMGLLKAARDAQTKDLKSNKDQEAKNEDGAKSSQKGTYRNVRVIDSNLKPRPNPDNYVRSRQNFSRAANPANPNRGGTNPAQQRGKHEGNPAEEGRHEVPNTGRRMKRGRHEEQPAFEGNHEVSPPGRHMKP